MYTMQHRALATKYVDLKIALYTIVDYNRRLIVQ